MLKLILKLSKKHHRTSLVLDSTQIVFENSEDLQALNNILKSLSNQYYKVNDVNGIHVIEIKYCSSNDLANYIL